MEISDELIDSLMPAVEQQIASPETPFVKKACERLVSSCKCNDREAKELIAQALAIVSNRMMASGKPFDLSYYKELLSALPSLPDESD